MNPVKLGIQIGGLLLALILLASFWPFVGVPAGHRGVVVTFGQVSPKPLTEGIHMVNPLSKVYEIDVRLQKADTESNASSKDLQTITTHLAVNYRLNSEAVAAMYADIGLDIENKVIDPIVQDRLKAVTADYTAAELVTKREQVRMEAEKFVRAAVTERSKGAVHIESLALTNFGFSRTFNAAIEAKQKAEQDAQRAENELKKAKVDAEARIAQARGEAEAIRIQAQSVAAQGGDDYVKLKWIEKWNGQLPTTTLGGNTNTLVQLPTK